MEERASFPRSADSARAARHWAARWCSDHGCVDEVDSVVLVISELVTNALLHGEGQVEVGLSRRGDQLSGFVRDECPEMYFLDARSDRIGGWGLAIVAQLTSSWGVDTDSAGKTVRFEFPRRPPPPPLPPSGSGT